MNPDFYFQLLQNSFNFLTSQQATQLSAITGTSFVLIIAAEIGDKSQLVCMSLASRHPVFPVILGASAAFIFLNIVAVFFGVAIANWLPDYILATIVSLLFSGFGIHALFNNSVAENDEVVEKSGFSIFFTTFLLITVAEFGDKTQLAVVALSSTTNPYAVWVGSTMALISTSVMGVLAGRALLRKIPLSLIHKVSGIIFLILAVLAGLNAYHSFISIK